MPGKATISYNNIYYFSTVIRNKATECIDRNEGTTGSDSNKKKVIIKVSSMIQYLLLALVYFKDKNNYFSKCNISLHEYALICFLFYYQIITEQ